MALCGPTRRVVVRSAIDPKRTCHQRRDDHFNGRVWLSGQALPSPSISDVGETLANKVAGYKRAVLASNCKGCEPSDASNKA